jgi:DNA polymerase III subunit epsilon
MVTENGRTGGAPELPAQTTVPKPGIAALRELLQVDATRRAEEGIRIALKPRPAAQPLTVAAPVDAPLRDLEYVVVDVETTGGAANRGHRVTEVALLRIRGDGTLVDEFTSLINPERPIPPFISTLTNITSAMVADAPRFAEIEAPVRRLLEGAVFVAHNAGFDWRFVSSELERIDGVPLQGRSLCTVRLARRVVPEIPSRSLDALTVYFGIENHARHRAYGDAQATAVVLGRLLDRCEEREIFSWLALEEMLSSRKPRTRRQASPGPVLDA